MDCIDSHRLTRAFEIVFIIAVVVGVVRMRPTLLIVALGGAAAVVWSRWQCNAAMTATALLGEKTEEAPAPACGAHEQPLSGATVMPPTLDRVPNRSVSSEPPPGIEVRGQMLPPLRC